MWEISIKDIKKINDLEVKLFKTNDINELVPEIKTLIQYENLLVKHIKNERARFDVHIKEYKTYLKRVKENIDILKNKVVDKIESGEGFKIVKYIDQETGEVKEKLKKKFPTCFGIIKGKNKVEINLDYKFPKKYYKQVLDMKKINEAIENGELPKNAYTIIKTDTKISWLPKNLKENE